MNAHGNDRVLVIGGTRGTGLLIARSLLQRNYRVRILARDLDRARRRVDPAAELVVGDITQPATLQSALRGSDHVVCTAGVHSGRYASDSLVRRTDYEGVLNVLLAAKGEKFTGRFLYMNSIGVGTPSSAAFLLNLLKRNTLVWRRRAEREIRASGIDYTIIRVGFLTNAPAGRRVVEVGQGALPLAARHRIARADVADAFVAALEHRSASRTTFEIVWGKDHGGTNWNERLDRIEPDQIRQR